MSRGAGKPSSREMDRALVDRLAPRLAAVPGLRLALLFGSEARGTAGSGSDVDLAVAGAGLDVAALSGALSAELDRELDVVRLEGASIPMLEELLRDAIPVVECVPGAYALWRSRTLASLELDRPWYARMRDAHLARLRAGAGGGPR